MRSGLLSLSLLLAPLSSASAQAFLGVHVGTPGVSIGVEIPVHPELVQVPGEPVYYAPRVAANYFFFDGVYWVFRGDRWYASAAYGGPWQLVGPEYVPMVVLQVPVRYYRQPPAYFHPWRGDESPRWGERWGRGWERRHAGWDRHAPPRPAAIPVYRREEREDRHAHVAERQRDVRIEHGHDRPREDGSRRPGASGQDRQQGRGHGDDHGRGGGRGRED